MTTCTTQNTITAGDIDGLNKDIDTISEVVESTDLTATTKNGRTIDTLTGRLLKLGYMVPVPYESGIGFSVTDNTKTIERDGIIYAPYPGSLPFTTSGTWIGDDDAHFYPIQGQLYANTLSDLRAIPPGSARWVQVLGHTSVNDGGGGVFALYQGSVGQYVDDNGITVVPDGGDGSTAYVREISDHVTPEMFGGRNSANISDAIDYVLQNIVSYDLSDFEGEYGAGAVYLGPNEYNIDTAIELLDRSLLHIILDRGCIVKINNSQGFLLGNGAATYPSYIKVTGTGIIQSSVPVEAAIEQRHGRVSIDGVEFNGLDGWAVKSIYPVGSDWFNSRFRMTNVTFNESGGVYFQGLDQARKSMSLIMDNVDARLATKSILKLYDVTDIMLTNVLGETDPSVTDPAIDIMNVAGLWADQVYVTGKGGDGIKIHGHVGDESVNSRNLQLGKIGSFASAGHGLNISGSRIVIDQMLSSADTLGILIDADSDYVQINSVNIRETGGDLIEVDGTGRVNIDNVMAESSVADSVYKLQAGNRVTIGHRSVETAIAVIADNPPQNFGYCAKQFPWNQGSSAAVRQTVDDTVLKAWYADIGEGETVQLSADVVGVSSDGANRACYKLAACIYRVGAGVAQLLGTSTPVYEEETDSFWFASFAVDGNGCKLELRGNVGQTVDWRLAVRMDTVS